MNDAARAMPRVDAADLERSIRAGTQALLGCQQPDGHWVFELEADATIPAEYVLLRHYLGETPDDALEAKIAAYLRRIQGAHDGWPLIHGGDFDLSATVKAYFALKMIGHSPDADHMRRARAGDPRPRRRGQQQCVHARSARALRRDVVAQRPGDAGRDHAAAALVPFPPRQDLLLGAHRDRAAAGAAGAQAESAQPARDRDRRAVRAAPTAVGPPGKAPHQKWVWFLLFRTIDIALRAAEPMFPKAARARAIDARLPSCANGSTARTASARSIRPWRTR